MPAVREVLSRYGAELDHAVGVVLRLQARWDDAVAQFETETRRVSSLVGAGAEQEAALACARERFEAAKARLSRAHANAMDMLRAADARAAARIQELCDETFGVRRVTGVRADVLGGLSMAAGASRLAEAREAARVAASQWRALGGDPHPVAVARWLEAHEGRLGDEDFVRAFVSEVGVAPLLATLNAVASPGARADGAVARDLAAAVGRLLVVATRRTTAGADGQVLDPLTTQVRSATRELLRDELVNGLDAVLSSHGGRVRSSGYWLLGQALVGARVAGFDHGLDAGLLARLTAATAAAELGETRDSGFELAHGTTLDGRGDQFATLFSEVAASGDALHVLLNEVRSADTARTVLAEGVDAPLRNARGGRLTVAEYLVRRWIAYDNATPSSVDDLRLATTDDLRRLLGMSASDGSEASAELQARVSVEVGRTSAAAQLDHAMVVRYEGNVAAIEALMVPWLAAVKEAAVAAQQALVAHGDAYAVARGDGGYDPSLRLHEVVALVQAFALDGNFEADAKDPAEGYQRLLEATLEHLRAEVAAGTDVTGTIRLLGLYDAAASAALQQRAVFQDAMNKRMWENLIDAGLLTAGIVRFVARIRLQATGDSAAAGGSDLLVELLRSDLTGLQAQTNAARTTALAAEVRDIIGERGVCFPVAELFSVGAEGAPRVLTPDEAARSRTSSTWEVFNAHRDAQNLSGVSEGVGTGGRDLDATRAVHSSTVGSADGARSRLDTLPRGISSKVRMVRTEQELLELHADLARGGTTLTRPGYPGPG